MRLATSGSCPQRCRLGRATACSRYRACRSPCLPAAPRHPTGAHLWAVVRGRQRAALAHLAPPPVKRPRQLEADRWVRRRVSPGCTEGRWGAPTGSCRDVTRLLVLAPACTRPPRLGWPASHRPRCPRRRRWKFKAYVLYAAPYKHVRTGQRMAPQHAAAAARDACAPACLLQWSRLRACDRPPPACLPCFPVPVSAATPQLRPLLAGPHLPPSCLSSPQAMFLDADATPVLDPSLLFEHPQYRQAGSMFWPELWCVGGGRHAGARVWGRVCGRVRGVRGSSSRSWGVEG